MHKVSHSNELAEPDESETAIMSSVSSPRNGFDVEQREAHQSSPFDTVERTPQAACNASSMLVDVDGFYTHVTSFNTMLHEGAGRIVVVAGGSGVTSLMGFIQVS